MRSSSNSPRIWSRDFRSTGSGQPSVARLSSAWSRPSSTYGQSITNEPRLCHLHNAHQKLSIQRKDATSKLQLTLLPSRFLRLLQDKSFILLPSELRPPL